jgi:hypothetical protein
MEQLPNKIEVPKATKKVIYNLRLLMLPLILVIGWSIYVVATNMGFLSLMTPSFLMTLILLLGYGICSWKLPGLTEKGWYFSFWFIVSSGTTVAAVILFNFIKGNIAPELGLWPFFIWLGINIYLLKILLSDKKNYFAAVEKAKNKQN